MILTNALLVLETCLNSAQNITTASNLDNLYSSADEVISEAIEAYDYDDFDLDFDGQNSLAKQKLCSYLEGSDEYTTVEIMRLESSIKKSSDYKLFENIETIFLKDGYNGTLMNKISSFEAKRNSSDIVASWKNADIKTTTDSSLSTCGMNDMSTYEGGGGGGTQPNKKIDFPIRAYNANNATCYTNGKLDNVEFVGIACSKDACVGFYNRIAGILNNVAYYKTMGIKGPVAIAYELFTTYSALTPTITAISILVEAIASYFAGFFTEYFSLFLSNPPLSIILGAIIALFAGACLFIVCTIFTCGYFQKGFAFGWQVYNFFRWEFYCGTID